MSQYEIPNFSLAELLREAFGYRLKENPNGFYCPCPFHNHDSHDVALRIYERDHPSRHGFICHYGKSGNTWDLLEELGYAPPGHPGFDDTLRFVADNLGIDLEESEQENTRRSRALTLLRQIDDQLGLIRMPEQNHHYWYEDGQWYYRGLTPSQWLSRGVGQLDESSLKSLTREFDDDTFEAAGINAWGNLGYKWLTDGVIVMYYDNYRTPVGLAVRQYRQLTPFDEEPEPKYVAPSNQSETLESGSYVFGLGHFNRHSEEEPVVYVVEGQFDCLALQMRGLPNVLSTGSGHPSKGQVERLRELGREIVFVPDSDSAGFDHAARIAENYPDFHFLLLPGEDVDPDEYVQQYGTDSFADLTPFTGLQIQMYDEPAFNGTGWERHKTELAEKYMASIIQNPSAYDETNVNMVAQMSGLDEDYLKSWLFQARNENVVASLQESNRPVRIVS